MRSSWVTTMAAVPRAFISARISSITWAPRSVSSAEVGSSNSTSFGSFMSGSTDRNTLLLAARQLRRQVLRPVGQAELGQQAVGSFAGRLALATAELVRTTRRFSRALRNGTRLTDWNTKPTFVLAERGQLLVAVPGDLTRRRPRPSPGSGPGCHRRSSTASSLPEPDGPTRATISSWPTVRVAWSSATMSLSPTRLHLPDVVHSQRRGCRDGGSRW